MHAWRYWLPPALISLILTLVYLNPFIGDWDALDYTVFSIHGRPSSMALGRSLFTLFNFALYRVAHTLFGVPPERAYLLFKFAVVIASPLAVLACWVLARELSGSIRSATIAALLVTCSPIMVIYGGQVMTDVPSVLFTAAALAIHVRGVKQNQRWLILAGAAVLGLGVNLRETVSFYAPWLVFAPLVAGLGFNRQTFSIVAGSVLVFLIFAFGPFLIWFASSPAYRADWYVWLYSMQREAARHPVVIANLKPFLIYFTLASPLTLLSLPFALWMEWRERGWTLMLAAATVALFATVTLFLNYSTTINWRYFLTGLPGLAPLAGDFLIRVQTKRFSRERLAFVNAILCIALVAVAMGMLIQPRGNEYFNRLAQAKTYDMQLKLIPADAVVIAGAQTVAVQYWRGIGLGQWDWIGVGAGWPQGQLESKIAEHLNSGRRVFLDADPRWWLPCSWHVSEIGELAKIEPHFHFRKVAGTIYEIRLIEDTSATDRPHLELLLPENRKEEASRCFDSG